MCEGGYSGGHTCLPVRRAPLSEDQPTVRVGAGNGNGGDRAVSSLRKLSSGTTATPTVAHPSLFRVSATSLKPCRWCGEGRLLTRRLIGSHYRNPFGSSVRMPCSAPVEANSPGAIPQGLTIRKGFDERHRCGIMQLRPDFDWEVRRNAV